MELKDYQKTALEQVEKYLRFLAEWKGKAEKNPELEIDFTDKAWEKSQTGRPFYAKTDGLGRPLPNFCLKIPTGGGKTLLAVKSIDLANSIYRKQQTGLVLWIVPSQQIYSQTLKALRNREHPYRQHLDMASGGRTKIVEKIEKFTPGDVAESLVVLMLMLPSANRQTKETLRMFKDNGGFQQFFPDDDDARGHGTLLDKLPNLDCFGEDGDWTRQIKTSLGNTLRLLNPLVVLDEGQKAYSTLAQETIRGFNPSLIVELSATPPEGSNVLVDISGTDLDREEMIKLDLHINNKSGGDWKDTLLAAVERREELERQAVAYESKTGTYIRPIVLVQAERIGKEQRGGSFIHSEDIRDWLVQIHKVPPEQVAVKTSETNELKEVDDVEGGLLSPDCQIRYIITKQALQEGWDCPFAYVLAVLTNPRSETALTQLVGRILRQPNAKKTGVKALDESYVYCFRRNADELLESIRKGLKGEGLGDLTSSIRQDGEGENGGSTREIHIRKKFQKIAKKMILPVFVIKQGKGWRLVNYAVDIESRVPWKEIDIEGMKNLELLSQENGDVELLAGISQDVHEVIIQKEAKTLLGGVANADSAFLARHLADVVPNPWLAEAICQRLLVLLTKKNGAKTVARNLAYIIEEAKKTIEAQKDKLAEQVFRGLISSGDLRFLVILDELGGNHLPETVEVKQADRTLLARNGMPLEKSLFEFVPQGEFNETEKTVAWYLDDHGKLFFWYRNRAKQDYAIQGWKPHKVYPDFIFTVTEEGDPTACETAYVVETKGTHLKNEDTDYKKALFDLCNSRATAKKLHEVGKALACKSIEFKVVFGDEWQRRFNEMLADADGDSTTTPRPRRTSRPRSSKAGRRSRRSKRNQ